MANESYNLGGILKLYPAYSRGRIENDKAKAALTAAGATIGETGNQWSVTVNQLIAAELVQADGSPFEVIKRGTRNGAVSKRKMTAVDSMDIDELSALLEAASADEKGYGSQVTALESKYSDAKKIVRDYETAKEKHALAAKDVKEMTRRYDRIKDRAAKDKAANIARLRAELEAEEVALAKLS